MLELWTSIEGFCDEWSILIASGLVIVLFLLIMSWVKRYRIFKQAHRDHIELINARNNLINASKRMRSVCRAFVAAIEGSTDRYSRSPSERFYEITSDWWKALSTDLNGWTLPELPTFKRIIDLIWCMRTLVKIETHAKNVTAHADKSDDSPSATTLVGKLQESVKRVSELLPEFLPHAIAQQYLALIQSSMKSIVIASHAEQAKHCALEIDLGGGCLKMSAAQQFAKHCKAGNVDPKELIDPKLHGHLEKALQAVELMEEASQPVESTTVYTDPE